MNRRSILTAALAAPVLAVPAVAVATTETPVMALFREWRAHNEWLNGPATNGMSEDEFDAVCADDMELIEALIATPSQGADDLCLKLIVATEIGEFTVYAGLRGADLLKRETRALIA